MVDPLSCPNPLHAPYLFCLPLSVSLPPLLFFLSPTQTLPHLFYPTWTFMCSPVPLVELFPSNLSDRSSLALTCSWTIRGVKGQVSYLYGMFHCLDRRVSDSMRREDSLTHTQAHTSLETFKEICVLPLLLRWEYHCHVDGKALPVVSQFSLQGLKLSS